MPLDVVGYEWNQTIRLLAEGHAALSFGGSYEGEALADALGVPQREVWDHFGFAHVPAGPRGAPASVAGGMMFAVFRQADQPALAMRLLESVVEPGLLARFARSSGRTPSRRSAIELVAPDVPSSHAPRSSSRQRRAGRGCLRILACPLSCRPCSKGRSRVDSVPAAAAQRTAEMIAAITGARWWRSRSSPPLPQRSDVARVARRRRGPSRPDRASSCRPGRQRHGLVRPARSRPLSAPVELGLRADRNRARARRPGACASGGSITAPRPVAGRDGPAHRLPRPQSGLLAGPRAVGLRGLRRRARCCDERDHPTAGPRHGGARAPRDRPDPGFSTRSSRRSSVGTSGCMRRARTRTGLVAILHPWEGADNSPRFDAALARVEVDESVAIERTDRRVVAAERAADGQRLRALPLSRRASPGARIPPRLARGRAVRLRRPDPQLDPRDGRG